MSQDVDNRGAPRPGNEPVAGIPAALRRFGRGLAAYLSDWKNLLGHTLVGLGFLAAAIWVPVPVLAKLAVIAVLVVFNLSRGRRRSRKARVTSGKREKQ